MRKKKILWMAAMALLALPLGAFTKMDVTRVLLMNDDTNETWAVSGQGYINTNAIDDATYWIHEGDPAPETGVSADVKELGLLDGNRHTFFAKLWDDDQGNVLTPLWQLEYCRAGNAATTNRLQRHFVPWSSTAVPRDGVGVEYETVDVRVTIVSNWVQRPRPAHWEVITNIEEIAFYDFSQVATINMQNTTNSFVISPYYKDGIGAIYFDFVNGWYADRASEIQIQVATGTNGLGTLSFADETNYSNLLWRTQKFNVYSVRNGSPFSNATPVLSSVASDVAAFTPSAPNENFYGDFFYRVRAFVNLHEPARFRIWRSKHYESDATLDAPAFLILDNIVASYPPVEVEIKQYGKYDATRRGPAVLGQEGTFNVPFPHAGQNNVKPLAYYEGKTCPFVETSADDFNIASPKFYYRWRYLNQVVSPWTVMNLNKSGNSKLVAPRTASIDLSKGIGDVEFYYTLNMTKAPHYEPFDFCVGLAEPYGVGWREDGTAWTVTQRRDPSAGIIAATQGTDWFVRIREGESDCREVLLQTSKGDPGVDEGRELKTVQMELVGDHSWRAYLDVRKADVGKSLLFRFAPTILAEADGGGFDSDTSDWAPNITTNNALPCSAIAVESDTLWGETILDGLSGNLVVEYNDETHAVSLTRGEYQNFNLWTDANRGGYVGHSTDTNSPAMSGVSPQKKAYPETFDRWETKRADNPLYWEEHFTLNTPGDYLEYPFNIFFPQHKTPNGWAAENMMFVGEQYSAAYVTNGMAIQLEGRGKGFISYADKKPMPDGLDSVNFNARAAQFLEFDDFAYYLDGNSFENYAVGAQITMSTTGRDVTAARRDWSPGCPSISLVGYYRDTKGCYELRFTRVKSDTIEVALYRWNKSGRSVTSTPLHKMTTTANILLPTGSSMNQNNNWTGAYMALYNGTDRTYITVAMSSTPSTQTLAQDSANNRFTTTFTVQDPSELRLVKGSYGVGSCDCPARFGRIAQYNVSLTGSGDTSKVSPALSTEVSTVAEMSDEDNWALPPGRMEMINVASELYTWNYGIKASMPDQSIRLKLAPTGSGNAWQDSSFSVAVTSFVSKAYSFSPRLVEEYNIRLCAGGDENDARTDVVLDDIVMTQWHSGSWGDWADWTYPGAYTNWVYQQCWVGSLAEISDPAAYTVTTLFDTEEFVYTFTKVGTFTFTPIVDIELSRLLVVGGGGAGGNTMGGGGGGGGVVEASGSTVLRAGTRYTITVGGGGASATATSQNRGGNGENSVLDLTAGGGQKFTAYGGGGGGGWSQTAGQNGGSGGGAARNGTTGKANYAGQNNLGNNGASGNNGGSGQTDYGAGSGGGGAGSAGTAGVAPGNGSNNNGKQATGGNGGDGMISDITGNAVYYGGGGGGGVGRNYSGTVRDVPGEGGKGGGGKGGYHAELTGEDGVNGLGGGGGGGGWNASNKAGGRGGSGAVILRLSAGGKLVTMQPRRAKANEAVMIRSPYLNGISLFSFTFSDADPNARLRLQMATNSFGTADFRQLSLSLTDDRWIDVTNFTFTSQTAGTYTHFFGLREPIYGFVRLLCEPSIVNTVATNDSYAARPEYGSVTLISAVAYDEPILDDRSWFGWNMRTSDETPLAYLPDPAYNPPGLSGALNFTGKESDPEGDYGDELAAANDAYSTHDPFVQSPAIYNDAGVGQVQFRARVMDTNATISSWVSVYGSADSNADDEDWTLLKDIEVTNRTFRTFLWKTTDDISPYKAIRLAVRAAKYGRTGDPSQPGGRPAGNVSKIQRVLIDEVAVSEPIAPGITFAAISPFRTNLNQDPVKAIPNARSMDQQPLLGESFGVQVEVALAQLADELDVDSIKVFMSYYVGDSPWGYNVISETGDQLGWSNRSSVVELVRCTDSNLVWRSAYAAGHEDSVIPPQQDPGDGMGQVVQYYVWAEYKDTAGTNHIHRVLSSEWQMPSWYYSVDDKANHNLNNGGLSDPDKFCPYTILQTISPKRVWINCMNYFDGVEDPDAAAKNQFVELAVPSGNSVEGWYLRFTEFEDRALSDVTTFAEMGVGDIKSSKTSVNVYNSYDFLTLQAPATTTAKGYAADGTWYRFNLKGNSAANGTFTFTDCYAVELIRPNGIIEHQIVIGGTNQWEEYIFSGDYDPAVMRDKLAERDAGTLANWVLAGKDQNDGTVGVMADHGAVTNDWEMNLAQTPETRNRRRNGTYQTIPADWYLPPLGTNYWIYSYLSGGYIAQKSGKEEGDAIRLIVPKGTTTNITYTVEPWHRIATILSNDVDVTATFMPPFDAATRTYNMQLRDVSSNITFKVASGVAPKVDELIPATDPYHDAAVRWLESFGEEKDIIPAEFQFKGHDYDGMHISLKEMYWLDIYPFQTNRLVVGFTEATRPVTVPEDQIDHTQPIPALTNLRMRVYMMITNRETGVAQAPYTIQGLSNESSANDYTGDQQWTSATYKVIGQLQNPKEKVWRPLRYFVFDRDSFLPKGDPNEFTAEIDVFDPYSSQSPIYTDPDVRWWPYSGNGGGANIFYKTMLNGQNKPLSVPILRPTNRLTE